MWDAIVHFLSNTSVAVILLLVGLFLFIVALFGRFETPWFNTELEWWQRITSFLVGVVLLVLSVLTTIPPRPNSVPVGTVILWWGSLSERPEGFELCDGGPPTTLGAKLQGNKPDLVAKFARGAEISVTDVRVGTHSGGHDKSPLQKLRTDGTKLTIAQMPPHNHETSVSHEQNANFGRAADRDVAVATVGKRIGPQLTSTVGGGESHDHGFTLPEQDNRPSFQEVFYLIKVK